MEQQHLSGLSEMDRHGEPSHSPSIDEKSELAKERNVDTEEGDSELDAPIIVDPCVMFLRVFGF